MVDVRRVVVRSNRQQGETMVSPTLPPTPPTPTPPGSAPARPSSAASSLDTYPVVQQTVPRDAFTRYNNRPIRGIVLHHTAGQTLPTPARGASWHRCIAKDGTIYHVVDPAHAAHTIGNTNRWRPSWVAKCPPPHLVSDANYCTINYEIVYAPQEPHNETPTPAQYEALKQQLREDYLKYGPLPIIGHGEVDDQKWPTEPHGLDFHLLDCVRTPHGWFYSPPPIVLEEEPVEIISDVDLKAYFEQLGYGANMDTAIMKRASLAYRRGETRGPLISDEYPYQPDPTKPPTLRQRFTAGTLEYDPATGGIGWVELNINPELP